MAQTGKPGAKQKKHRCLAQRTQLDDCNYPLNEAYACLLASGLDGPGKALRTLVNEASRIEQAQHLQATRYERSAQRVYYANGCKNKTVLTRIAEMYLQGVSTRLRHRSPAKAGGPQVQHLQHAN